MTNKFKTIYKDGAYEISVNIKTGKALINNKVELRIAEPVDMPKFAAKAMENLGGNPINYFVSRSSQDVPIRNAAKTAWINADKEYRAFCLIPKFDGLDKLEAALDQEEQYASKFRSMMEDEDNDGVNPPSQVKVSYEQLAKKYPVAALYLRAKSYANASNLDKLEAGLEAVKIMDEKGEEAAYKAEELLNNWVPKSAFTN